MVLIFWKQWCNTVSLLRIRSYRFLGRKVEVYIAYVHAKGCSDWVESRVIVIHDPWCVLAIVAIFLNTPCDYDFGNCLSEFLVGSETAFTVKRLRILTTDSFHYLYAVGSVMLIKFLLCCLAIFGQVIASILAENIPIKYGGYGIKIQCHPLWPAKKIVEKFGCDVSLPIGFVLPS